MAEKEFPDKVHFEGIELDITSLNKIRVVIAYQIEKRFFLNKMVFDIGDAFMNSDVGTSELLLTKDEAKKYGNCMESFFTSIGVEADATEKGVDGSISYVLSMVLESD